MLRWITNVIPLYLYLKYYSVDALAAQNFEKAASYAEEHEAADSLEQAALCYKLAQNQESSARCYEKSMNIAVKLNRPAKAALLAEAMVDVVPNRLKALKLAERYYDLADDRRGSQVRERIANGLAEAAHYSEASRYFMQRAEELSRDQVLIRAARKNALLSMICSSLADQQPSNPPDWFVGSQEHYLYDHWLAYYSGEAEEFKSSLEMPSWLIKLQPSSSLC
jgi:tetratricopeptide (TPR) repeat protein